MEEKHSEAARKSIASVFIFFRQVALVDLSKDFQVRVAADFVFPCNEKQASRRLGETFGILFCRSSDHLDFSGYSLDRLWKFSRSYWRFFLQQLGSTYLRDFRRLSSKATLFSLAHAITNALRAFSR